MGISWSSILDLQEIVTLHNFDLHEACPNFKTGSCPNLEVSRVLVETLGTCEDCGGHLHKVSEPQECPVCIEYKEFCIGPQKCSHSICVDCFRGPKFVPSLRNCKKYLLHEFEFCLECAQDEMRLLQEQNRHQEIRQILNQCPVCRTPM